ILPSLFGITHSNASRSTKILWSVALHGTALLFLLWLSQIALWRMNNQSSQHSYRIAEVVFAPSSGGGGAHTLLAPSRGALPQTKPQQLAPPTTQTLNRPVVLPVEQSIVAPVVKADLKPVGDPFHGVLSLPSDGPGHGGGIGQGCCGGIGSGTGAESGEYPLAGRGGVSIPKVIYDPDPDYTDQARLNKLQGTVGLWIVVGTDGRVQDVRLRRGLGFGLDEKAMDAVRKWRFEPARKDGQPVAVRVGVDVEFRMF
ncbi:MAG TPA: TonB family protein, partial [Terriglobales bacterium]|nr:TonB family protein [Terriglobales bacterium]